MRKHRLHGFVLALLAAAGLLVILARPTTDAGAAAGAAAATTSPGWNHLSEGVGAGAAQAAADAVAAGAPPATNDSDDLASGTQQPAQLQILRTYIGTMRADQFNAMVATYRLQQLAAASAAAQAFKVAEAQEVAQRQAAAAQAPATAPQAPAATPSAGGTPGSAPPPPTAPSGGVWAALRQCESGGNYADDTGNGYYGAYQFSLGTWLGLGYSGLPSAAPPAVQDAAAQALQARSGWGQWPACARKLGLL
ncbi:MAG: transglycosylase family protein [Acidimicrobiales bacterium]